jgi:HPt (histidine-containing phosphotransfer) domain-containing protein
VDEPILDELTIDRLRQLAKDVAEPGEDVIGDLIATYRDDANARLPALKRALDAGDLADAAEEAHALRGASSTIGASRCAEALKLAEASLVAGDPADDLHDRLRAEVDAALAVLEGALGGSR